MHIEVQNVSSSSAVPNKEQLSCWAEAAFFDSNRAVVELAVRIVDEAESAELNQRYRNQDKPTNVLSFAYEDPPGVITEFLGDLVICAPLVEREAETQRRTPESYWAHMVVHGVMHLRGFDHEDGDNATLMQQKETKAMHRLGFQDPYC